MSARVDVALHDAAATVPGACRAAWDVFNRFDWEPPLVCEVRHLADVAAGDSFTTVEAVGPVLSVTVYLPDLSDTEPEGRRSMWQSRS